MQVQSLVKNAPKAWPTMVHVASLPERGESVDVPELDDLRLDGHGHVHPAEANHDLRILGLGQIVTTVAPDGRPIGMAREGVRGTTAIAINAGTLTACFTAKRLTGAFLSGRVGGMVSLDRRSAWMFSIPWEEVTAITLIMRPHMDTGEDAVAGMAIQGPIGRPGPGALVIEPGNWMSLEDRSAIAIDDRWTVVDDAMQRVSNARGVPMPEFVVEEDGTMTAGFVDED